MAKDIYACIDCAIERAPVDFDDYEVRLSEIPVGKLDKGQQYCTCDLCGKEFNIWTYPTYKF